MRKKFELRLLPQAEEDLLEILEYISADKPSAAEKLSNRFEEVFEMTTKNPLVGSTAREPRLKLLKYRYFPIGNYVLFYQIKSKTIFVFRILHGARDYRTIL